MGPKTTHSRKGQSDEKKNIRPNLGGLRAGKDLEDVLNRSGSPTQSACIEKPISHTYLYISHMYRKQFEYFREHFIVLLYTISDKLLTKKSIINRKRTLFIPWPYVSLTLNVIQGTPLQVDGTFMSVKCQLWEIRVFYCYKVSKTFEVEENKFDRLIY